MYKKILLLSFILLYPQITFGAVQGVSCSSSPYFTSTCTQCFNETTNVYLGYGATNLSDTWQATSFGNYIYPDENTNPVNIRAFYLGGELQKGTGGFSWSSNLYDTNQSNGEFFVDGGGYPFVKFLPSTSGKILQSQSSFFIKFANLSQSIRNNGRNYPLWETQYTINYYNIGSWTQRTHKECILNYPAWCGDGVLDSTHGETCDDGNNTPGDGCNATCQTEVVPTCNSLSATPSTGSIPLTTSFNCNATLATSYKIDIFSGSTIINTITNATGTGTYTFTNSGTYNARCTINGSVTSPTCNATITATPSGPSCGTAGGHVFSYSDTNWGTYTFCSTGTPNPNPPVFPSQGGSTSWTCNGVAGSTPVTCSASRGSPGGGGSDPDCIRIDVGESGSLANKTFPEGTTITMSCHGSSNAQSVKLECGNGTSFTQNGTRDLTSTCTYSTVGTYNPTCYVGKNIIDPPSYTSFACSTKVSITGGGGGCTGPYCGGGGGSKGFCGDGVVQRPNDNGVNEECDKTLVNGILQFPSWCGPDCKTKNFTYPGVDGPILTYPNGGSISIYPNSTKVIMGQGSDPIYDVLGVKPYIKNDSSDDLYIEHPLCVYKTNSNLTGTSPYCGTNIGWIYPGVIKELSYSSQHFVGAVVPSNLNYLDSNLKITIGGLAGFNYSTIWPYFTKTIEVRISKPAIATVGGGTTLVKNTNTTADISKVAGNDYSNPDKNKNFVGAGVSTGSLSSYTKSVTGSTSVTNISSGQTNKVIENINKISNTTSLAPTGSIEISSVVDKYNGISNVYIVKNKNLTINSIITGFGARTYIVEGGDLNINVDINYSDNIAFVVKGGNINIASTVKNINGTFISIPTGTGSKGKIISAQSSLRLVINGSLYGDISSLVANRTYIQNTTNNIINVGTVVSFGSNLFRQPAPLVGDFIGEYMKSQKVAK